MKILFISIITFLSFSICSKAQNLGSGLGNISINDENGTLFLFPTTLFTLINGTTTTFNILKIRKPNSPDKYKSNAIFGIISGVMQTGIGLGNISAKYRNAYIPKSVNICFGAATIATSIIRLARKTPKKDSKIGYHLFYLPNFGSTGFALGLNINYQLD